MSSPAGEGGIALEFPSEMSAAALAFYTQEEVETHLVSLRIYSVLSRAQRGLPCSVVLCPWFCNAQCVALHARPQLKPLAFLLVFLFILVIGTPQMSLCVPERIVLVTGDPVYSWGVGWVWEGVVLTPLGPSWTCSTEKQSPVMLIR